VSFNLNNIEKLASAIAAAIPNLDSELKGEIKKNLKPILSSALKKMDLVALEDFELQKSILKKTRQKLEELEKKIAHLEKNS
tara:strand:- start:128 stop:373 length:246 start_codon:yes stop_codon:yes gene_type:complete